MAKTHRKAGAVRSDKRQPAQRLDILVYILLLLTTLAVYSQVRSYDFVNYDDREYVSENSHVRAGLTWESMVWAFTSDYDGNWLPLTWLSHMADCQLFGLRSGLHHLTNVLFHTLSTLLLFAFLKRMTGSRWRSAFVACLFALHPLHVESVAWVTERKDVLSCFFWFLALWAYLRYVERPRPGRYLIVLVSFCLGLMSKSMIITLPFVLLLLDFWPLRRIRVPGSTVPGEPKQKLRLDLEAKPGVGSVLREKVPFFALSACMAAVTFMVQRRGGAVISLDWIPLGTRLATALISYIVYIAKVFWPWRLAAFYPHPLELPAWQVITAGLAVAGISVLVLRSIRRFPYLAVGWFWYLGTLVPVIGLVQVGMQARADRYTYIPSVGILLMLAWGAADLFERRPRGKYVLAGLATAACAACLILTWFQIQYWKDSASLFQHALRITADNQVAHNGLGVALVEQGKMDDAIWHYQEAIRIRPNYPEAHANLGDVYLRLRRTGEAIQQLSEAIRLNPDSPEARINLGIALGALGKTDDSIAQLLEAVRIWPGSANAHYNLGNVYAGVGRLSEATAQFYQAVRLEPDNAEAHYNLGVTLARQDNMSGAIAEFATAIRLKPDYAGAHNNLGSALANLGRIDEAIAEFSEAVRLSPDSEEARRNLEYARSLKK
ncbi:MAG: tetratricopeptide repeat protein [Acidobacteriia bacterium]|nr:tetratricopeptide repeat protein [Terriglobia bacterium]